GVTDTFVYTYDTAGRLTDVTKNGAVVGHYTYDSNGNRLSATDQTGTVNGTYDAQDRLLTYGNLQYTYTTNGELLTKNNPVLGQTASFTYDVVGNLKSVSLLGGLLVDYVEFGNVTLDTNPGFQPFGFAGGLYDQHTGLTRFGARDYDAQIGRWTAKDPIDFLGGNTNLYGYALNDPVNISDSSGRIVPL